MTPVSSGDDLLNRVRDTIAKYCILPSDHAFVAVTLWIALTHALPSFDFAPRLVVRSALKRSGKTRFMEVITPMVHHPLKTSNASVAYIFRSLDDAHPPTILHDEADTIFGSKKSAENHEDLRGLYNAGFQRGQFVGRVVGPNHEPVQFTTFAMVALAGIGKMPDTIEDRAVVIVLRRRKADETVAPFRTRRDEKPLKDLGEELHTWVSTIAEVLTNSEPTDLGVEDRAADVWEPLISIADAAGGEWPRLARAAAVALSLAAEEEDEESSAGLSLLRDIKEVFDKDFIRSQELVVKLRSLEESPWGDEDLNPPKLGLKLREFQIRTRHNREKTVRGYHLADFRDAFDRYLPEPRPSMSDRVQNASTSNDAGTQSDAPDIDTMSRQKTVSHDNRRSDHMRTGLDADGRGHGRAAS